MLARDAAPGRRQDRDTRAAEAIESRVRRIVADRLGISPAELLPDTSLADDLAVDSLDLIEIAIAVETEVGVVDRGAPARDASERMATSRRW